MLQTLRDKTSGWIATVILGLLIVPFAFFGMEQYLFQRSETFAAKIEAPPAWWPTAPGKWPVTMLWQREEIGTDEFRQAFERLRQQQRTQLGENFDARAFESADNKRRILDDLVDQRVMKLASSNAGIAIGDSMVRETIQAIPEFQVDGRFDPQRYQLALASQIPPVSPSQFDQQVREGLQQGLLQTQVAQSAFVTKAELDRLLKLLGETRSVAFANVPRPAADAAPVAPAEIQRWYAAHASRYRAPEAVSFEYIDIDAATMPAPQLGDAELMALYEKEKSKFSAAEQRLTSHVLVKLDAGANAAAQKAALDKANAIAAQAKATGADFAAIARVQSDDTGSKSAGGDLGWVEKGLMPKAFEDALFAMQGPGVIGPVKTESGYHVIQLREVKAGQAVPFEQAREQLVREHADTEREKTFNALIGKVVDEALKNPSSLAGAARLAGVPLLTAPSVSRGGGEGIAANPAVQRAAFSDTLVQDGTVSDPIEIAPNHSVFIRVTGHQPERTLPLAQVGQRVVAEIRGDRIEKAAVARADAILAKVEAGASLASVAAAEGLAVTTEPSVPRSAPMLDPQSAEAVFSVPAPAAGKVSTGKSVTPQGVVVFAVGGVQPGKPEDMPAAQRAQLQQQLAQFDGSQDGNALVSAWRRKMKITVAEDRL